MANKWIVLDCSYLCHRARHTTGFLNFDGTPTGVIYGFLRFLRDYKYKTVDAEYVFCFDSRKSKRQQVFAGYKQHRKQVLSQQEQKIERDFHHQLNRLRLRYLPDMGFKNVFLQSGYEADDIIASICKHRKQSDIILIVSSDKDLYQLLRSNVHMHDPYKDKIMTPAVLRQEFLIGPDEWWKMLAIAGCSSDSVPGIKGIGQHTAIRILNDNYPKDSVLYARYEESQEIIDRNLKLVKLPFPGVKYNRPQKNNFNRMAFRRIVKSLGMKSLMKG